MAPKSIALFDRPLANFQALQIYAAQWLTNSTSDPSIQQGPGVTVTRIGVGQFRVTLDVALKGGIGIIPMLQDAAAGTARLSWIGTDSSAAPKYFDLEYQSSDGVAADTSLKLCGVIIVGYQSEQVPGL